MLLLLAVSLYTSRVILKVLGIIDYGIYNLIAGFVTFLAFISNALVSAMQRYFNVALGKKDFQNYKEVFSMSINILVIFSLFIFLLGETLGLWFVMNHLNIPASRYVAALWVFQFSLLTFIVNTLRIPFHASIIAHEKMSFYAYVSLFEIFIRLGMVFILMVLPGDHLIIYALLYVLVVLLVNAIYIQYCSRRFLECRYEFKRDKVLFWDLISFSGWTLTGQASVMIKNQGEAILINRFFTVAANAAMGVAVQVAGALELFVSNFQTAFNPQLIQSYASHDYDAHKNLLFRASKFSYFLLLILLVPIVSNIDFILNLWLTEVPEYTNYFVIFILISYLFNALSTPFFTSLNASGNIKYYQIALSGIFLGGLLIIYYILNRGAEPYTVSIVAVLIQLILLIARLYFAHRYVAFSYTAFFKQVICRGFIVSFFAFLPTSLFYGKVYGFWLNSVIIIIEGLLTCFLIFVIGLNRSEKSFVINILKKRMNKK